jgi:hypothetical protein
MDIIPGILKMIAEDPNLSPAFARALRREAHIANYSATIAALPPMSSEQLAEIRADREREWADESRAERLRDEQAERDAK